METKGAWGRQYREILGTFPNKTERGGKVSIFSLKSLVLLDGI